MKAITLFALLLLVTATSFAQLTVFGGPQQSWSKYRVRDVSQVTGGKTGVVAGVGLKTLLEGPVYFSPQLSYSQKGYSVRFTERANPPDSAAVANDVTLRSVNLTPMLQVNFSKQANYLFVRFGPSFEFNISGTEKYDSTNGRSVTRSLPFAFDKYSYASVSLVGQLGFQHHSGLTVFAFYNHNVSSLNNSDYGPKIFIHAAGLAAGWKFGKGR